MKNADCKGGRVEKCKLVFESEDINYLKKIVAVLTEQGFEVPEIQRGKVEEIVVNDTITVKFHKSSITQAGATYKDTFDRCLEYKKAVFDLRNVKFIDSEVINSFIKVRG